MKFRKVAKLLLRTTMNSILLLSALFALAYSQSLRIVHTAINVLVDVQLDDLLVLEDTPFGTVSEFRPVTPGSHTVRVFQAVSIQFIAI